MNIGQAMEAMRKGFRLSREGWYDEVLEAQADYPLPRYVVLQRGYPRGIAVNRNTAQATGIPEGTECYFEPYFMRHLGNRIFEHYSFVAEDMLAEDWFLVLDTPDGLGYITSTVIPK